MRLFCIPSSVAIVNLNEIEGVATLYRIPADTVVSHDAFGAKKNENHRTSWVYAEVLYSFTDTLTSSRATLGKRNLLEPGT